MKTAQHLQYFRSSKPSLFTDIAILDDYLYKAVDSFQLMCLYSQSTLFQKRPLFTIYNLINGYLCNYVDVEYNYRQPPFERPTIEQLLKSIANDNKNNVIIRKYSEIFLRLFDRYKFQSIDIDRTQEQSEQLKIFKELFLVFCLLPRTIKSLKLYRPSEIFGQSHLLSIIDFIRDDFNKQIEIVDENYHKFLNLITSEHSFISNSNENDSSTAANNNNNNNNSINTTSMNDRRRSKTSPNSTLSTRLRRHSLDQILSDGIRVCDVERLYQHQNEIFDRCCCVHTVPIGSNTVDSVIHDEDLVYIRIDPAASVLPTVSIEVKHFILGNAGALINDRLKRMGTMNVHDKLFAKTVTTLVLIHRPTGRLLAVLTFDFRSKENLGELIFLVVTPRYQRRGYGSMLLSIMAKMIIPECSEYAVHADLGAIDFYKRIGFIEETNTKEIIRLEKFMGQYTGSVLMRANRTIMMQKLRPLSLKIDLISIENIQPTRSNCPIHVGISQALSSSSSSTSSNDQMNEISMEELKIFHHTICEHLAPLLVATQNVRDSLAQSRDSAENLVVYDNLVLFKQLNSSLMYIDLARILYYRFLWFITHCQWKYRRDCRLTIARKVECHLKRLFVFKFGFEEMF
ncbi:Histone acetyltransferase kat2b [Dermatophagoides pteronyssinus]|uniref:Histone acetyltransferase kat2b n=1 Tax=Dermatophagoides pteronyssinus TaxID=6956 RepID=A0ABQ8JTD0_DERPT|nr:Histone acetyltransferase kat2b [Dermatophagoides pteronyssinus]